MNTLLAYLEYHQMLLLQQRMIIQIFLEECKYAVKQKKIMNTILHEELNLDLSDVESDNGKSNED